MKTLYFLLVSFLFGTNIANAQLIGITPNIAIPGQSLQTTITSSGLFIQNTSPSGNIYMIKLLNGPTTITIFDWNVQQWPFTVNVLDPNTVEALVDIPLSAPVGLYDLRVITGDEWFPVWNQVQYDLPGAFTVGNPDGYITGNVYDDINGNGIKDGTETGLANFNVKLLPAGTVVTTNASGDYSFPVFNGSYDVVILGHSSTAKVVTSGNDTLPVVINSANSPGNDFGLRDALVSITPSTGSAGSTGTYQINSLYPIFHPGANPYGNVVNARIGGAPVISVGTANITVIDSFNIEVIFPIPMNQPPGSNINVTIQTSTGLSGWHYLNQVFTIDPPDGLITGTVYHDLNKNGIKDVGEPGLPNRTVRLFPQSYNDVTDANGDYSFGASNGNYSLVVIPYTSDMMLASSNDTISVTVNNNTVSGNDFGLKRALISITPQFAYPGLTTTHQIVSDEPIFQVGPGASGNVASSVSFYTSPSSFNLSASSTVTVIDNYTMQIDITVPGTVNIGSDYDLRIYLSSISQGYHYLNDQFDIVPPPAIISGRIFFDSNQNKINDVGEPGIWGGKVHLMPDNTYGIANVQGNFSIASFGGPQTLTYTNNVNGLVLFTDSASYTFNASGAITNKDFGLLSTAPDYSFVFGNLYLFPRCNTIQPVSFTVRNTGNVAFDAVVWLKFDPQMTFVSSSTLPYTVSNDTVYWDVTNLPPYTSKSFVAQFSLPGTGTLNLTAGATSLNGSGAPQFSDDMTHPFVILCAFDPNDKRATPEGILAEHFTLMSDTLEYMIRFQNTGNDTAFNVVILDTLDMNLDYSTFEIVGSSHSVQTELLSNGALKFSFLDIMLVDSVANEPESHGYVIYRIMSQQGLPDSTEILNTAYIYFDFNAAVVTNTTLNTLVYVLPTGIDDPVNDKHVRIYPNPFSNSATLTFKNSGSDNHSLTLIDVTGKIVGPLQYTQGNSFTIEKNKLSKGIYFYRLKNINTNEYSNGKFVIE